MTRPYSSYGSKRERAKALLLHYLELAYGKPLDRDCQFEVGDIVDCIIDAVEEEATQSSKVRVI